MKRSGLLGVLLAVLVVTSVLLTASITGCRAPYEGADTGAADGSADFVMTNGKIYTVNEEQPWAEAVVVDGNMIVYVGDNAGAQAFVGEGTESIDLKSRLMLPGFVESHIHIGAGAGTTSGVILDSSDPVEVVLKKVADYAKEHPEKKTIFGASYSAFIFDEKNPPQGDARRNRPGSPGLPDGPYVACRLGQLQGLRGRRNH